MFMKRRIPLLVVLAAAAVVSMITVSAQGRGGRGAGQGPAAGGRGGQAPARDATAQTAIGTAVIAGMIVAEGSGTPVRRARVTLSATELRGTRSTLTDNQGRFVFPGLPAGRFTMTASKAGFVDISYGAKRAGRPGTQIQLSEGQKLDRAVIALPRGAVITGVVVDENGDPAAGVQVRSYRYVMRTGERTLQQAGQDQTDDRGMYRIFQLQPGEYVISAIARTPVVSDIRQVIASDMAVAVQQMGNSGTFAAAPLVAAGMAEAPADLAERVAQLQAQFTSLDAEAPPTSYAPVYYPGTTTASSAATITVGAGEERGNVDFQLQLVPTSRVGGLVVGPSGALPAGTQVVLSPADRGVASGLGFGASTARVGPDGRFTFNNVTPGQYVIQARAALRDQTSNQAAGGGRLGGPGPISQVLWASAIVDVSPQNTPPDTVLTLQAGMTVSGNVVFESAVGGSGSTPAAVRVNLTPRGSQGFELAAAPPPVVSESGRFSIVGVVPGRYSISAAPAAGVQRGAGPGGRGEGRGGLTALDQLTSATSAGWTLKSAVTDGRDLLDFPIDIGANQNIQNLTLTFTQRTQELSGMIQDTTGRPTADFTIIVFPSDARYWQPQARRITAARPGTDGRFLFRGLPPGDYRLTAVTDVEPGEWYDPAFLTQLSTMSIPVSVAEGEKKVQDIRLAGAQQ